MKNMKKRTHVHTDTHTMGSIPAQVILHVGVATIAEQQLRNVDHAVCWIGAGGIMGRPRGTGDTSQCFARVVGSSQMKSTFSSVSCYLKNEEKWNRIWCSSQEL